jgi:hypothetical protein
MTTCATVRVDGKAVHTIDYTDGLPLDELAQRTIAAVLKALRGLG